MQIDDEKVRQAIADMGGEEGGRTARMLGIALNVAIGVALLVLGFLIGNLWHPGL